MFTKSSTKLICDCLNYTEQNFFRLCSKNLSMFVGCIFFNNSYFDTKKIYQHGKHHFRSFVHKYKILIQVSDINNLFDLAYLNTYNVKNINSVISIIMSMEQKYIIKKMEKLLYYEYFIPKTTKVLVNFPLVKMNKLKIKKLFLISIENKIINENTFPKSLQVLYLDYKFNNPVNTYTFPTSLRILSLNKRFNQSINKLQLPNLEQLIFGEQFNQPINLTSFSSLKILTFGANFDQEVNDLLPQSLQNLILGVNFNRSIDKLPLNLKKLYLSTNFYQKINTFPKTLRLLCLGANYNQPIVNLPDGLTDIIFNVSYAFSLNLPSSIKRIEYAHNNIFKRINIE